jgi:ferredoxin hydrogenase large subunit
LNGFQKKEISRVIEINQKKCKGCDSCKNFCSANAIEGQYGTVHHIDTDKCIFCGQCLVNCPFGAPEDKVDAVEAVMEKLKDGKSTVVATMAPAVRVAIGEEYGLEPGKIETKKLYGALKMAGFTILDTNFAADQTIMEEGSELVAKIRHYLLGEPTEYELGALPQFTSCCPAWIRYTELNYPQLIPNLSSAKSPLMMAGALAKTYGAKEVWHVRPETMFVVAIMPCTAKKFEVSRPEFDSAARYWQKEGYSALYPDVDVVLTTRDLARLLKKMKIDFNRVPEFTDADNPLVQYSGAGTIFGNTGGVMEAALRTAYYLVTGTELKNLDFKPVRGLQGIKEASIPMKDAKTGKEITLRVAVAHGIKENAVPLIKQVLDGSSPYQFIEVMNCPGGCVNGGGQPINPMGTSWIDKCKAILPWT